jgi:nucleotide-binding universal stress UspA family protein
MAKQANRGVAKVLVATDLSRSAEQAFERAIRLPLGAGAEMRLLHVLPEAMPPSMRTRAEGVAGTRLQDLAGAVGRKASASSLKVTSEIAQGEPYVEIIRSAQAFGAGLIVLGRYGLRGIRSLMIGSTAMRVIRKGSLPVLVVSKKPEGKYARPLVAVDLEGTSAAVIESALGLADPSLSSVPVLHAYWPPFEGSVLAKLSPKELKDYHRGFQEKAESQLKMVLASLSDHGARCKPVVLRGDPRSVVLEEATRRRSDLIVVGTHARTGLSHALLGSVAEWLVSKARCDVLVARPSQS